MDHGTRNVVCVFGSTVVVFSGAVAPTSEIQGQHNKTHRCDIFHRQGCRRVGRSRDASCIITDPHDRR